MRVCGCGLRMECAHCQVPGSSCRHLPPVTLCFQVLSAADAGGGWGHSWRHVQCARGSKCQVRTSLNPLATNYALSVCPPLTLSPTPLQEVLDWFAERKLHAYSISAGQSLLYNDIFPKHKERLGKKMSELVVSVTWCVRVFLGGASTATTHLPIGCRLNAALPQPEGVLHLTCNLWVGGWWWWQEH